jgi:hypothetical protein
VVSSCMEIQLHLPALSYSAWFIISSQVGGHFGSPYDITMGINDCNINCFLRDC